MSQVGQIAAPVQDQKAKLTEQERRVKIEKVHWRQEAIRFGVLNLDYVNFNLTHLIKRVKFYITLIR